MPDTESQSSVQFTVAQAADFANVSTKTIRRWINEQGRLPARNTATGYVIDQADLERAMRGEPPTAPVGVLPLPERVRPAQRPATTLARFEPETFARQLAAALSTSISGPLHERLERQAERIGQLEAQLAVATAPKPARRPRTTPIIPRASIPIEPVAAASVLMRRFNAAELAQIASLIGSTRT